MPEYKINYLIHAQNGKQYPNSMTVEAKDEYAAVEKVREELNKNKYMEYSISYSPNIFKTSKP